MRHLVLLKDFLKHDWMKELVQKLPNDQMDKLFNNLKVPNQINQIQTQIMMIER